MPLNLIKGTNINGFWNCICINWCFIGGLRDFYLPCGILRGGGEFFIKAFTLLPISFIRVVKKKRKITSRLITFFSQWNLTFPDYFSSKYTLYNFKIYTVFKHKQMYSSLFPKCTCKKGIIRFQNRNADQIYTLSILFYLRSKPI